jgi:quercetin dioxygenase-like cupin family protein
MRQQTLVVRVVAAVMAIWVIAVTSSAQPQVGLERKILLQQDLAISGYEVVLAQVTLAVGGREGRHSHSGTLVAQILEGELTLELEGQPTKTVKAGEAVLVEPRQVHEGINKGGVPIKALATFIVEKGKPLATPAK